MPKKVNLEQQRNRILQAAIEVFSQCGIDGTGLAHVARAAHLSRPALYTYYPDKQALIDDLADFLTAKEMAMFASILSTPGSVAERMDSLNAGLESLIREESAGGAVMLQIWLTRPKHLQHCLETLIDQLGPVIAEGQRERTFTAEIPSENLARGLIALWDGLLLQACLSKDAMNSLDMAALARRLLYISSNF